MTTALPFLATIAPAALACLAVPVLADSALRWLSAFAALRTELRRDLRGFGRTGARS